MGYLLALAERQGLGFLALAARVEDFREARGGAQGLRALRPEAWPSENRVVRQAAIQKWAAVSFLRSV